MEDLLTVRQVSIILKVHPLTIRRYIKQGRLKAVRMGGNVRIPQVELQSFSDVYVASFKSQKINTESSSVNPLTPQDPIYRLKARGLSLDQGE